MNDNLNRSREKDGSAERKADGVVLHDYFAVREGGGRLALTLGACWGWPVVGGFVSREIPFHAEWANVELRELGVRPGRRPRQALSLARAWRKYHRPVRTVVYSGTYAPMAVANHIAARNVLYCHTPPRFMYDEQAYYLDAIPWWQRPALAALVRYLRPRYEEAVSFMDRIVVNSRNVQRRVGQYLGRESMVVHPPCDVERYQWHEPEGYYLSTARLDVLKRVDLVVRAFRKMPDKRLIVVSDGPERPRLEMLAGDAANISFAGEVGDERLKELIGRCIATIYVPRDEDFGMSPVESMAAGKPVIGVAEGGLLETVVNGETGVLVPADPGVDHVVEAVRGLARDRAGAMRRACEQRAAMFSTEKFLQGMTEAVGADDGRGPGRSGCE